jgi:hypothetical protein
MNHVRLGSLLQLSSLSSCFSYFLVKRVVSSFFFGVIFFPFSSSSSIGIPIPSSLEPFQRRLYFDSFDFFFSSSSSFYSICSSFGCHPFFLCAFCNVSGLRSRHMMDDVWIFISKNDEWLQHTKKNKSCFLFFFAPVYFCIPIVCQSGYTSK